MSNNTKRAPSAVHLRRLRESIATALCVALTDGLTVGVIRRAAAVEIVRFVEFQSRRSDSLRRASE